jgi:hypothetical protein
VQSGDAESHARQKKQAGKNRKNKKVAPNSGDQTYLVATVTIDHPMSAFSARPRLDSVDRLAP